MIAMIELQKRLVWLNRTLPGKIAKILI